MMRRTCRKPRRSAIYCSPTLITALVQFATVAEARGPSVLCIAVVQPGDDAKFVAQQFLEGIGIFGCDDQLIFSNVGSEELFQDWNSVWGLQRWPVIGPSVQVLGASFDVGTGGPYNVPLNVPIYDEVWRKVYTEGRYALYDWTVKLEPYTAFHPKRLKDVLQIHCSPQFTPNGCDSIYLSNDGPNLHGPIEALTRGAVQTLGEQALDSCKMKMLRNWTNSGEDGYLQACLDSANVKGVQEPNLLLDFDLHGISQVCDTIHGAFSRLPDWGGYMSCLGQASYSAPPDMDELPAEMAWTTDILQKAGYVKPTFLCWTLVQPGGAEPGLVDFQRQRGLGVFACDDWIVISNESARSVLGGQAWNTKITTINGSIKMPRSFASVGGSLVTVLASAKVFVKAWQAVFNDGRYRRYDWTLKVDPDLVIVPERLRTVLESHCPAIDGGCGKKILRNFGGDLRGPVEALSRDAVERLAGGIAECAASLDMSSETEFDLLTDCTGTLGIESDSDTTLLSDNHIGEPRPCDTVHATFHPFKDAANYDNCCKQSGYYYIEAPATSTETFTTTRTTTTRTSSTMTATSSTTLTRTISSSTHSTKTSTSRTATSRTTTSVTFTTKTQTVPHILTDSIWSLQGPETEKTTPPWMIGLENYGKGYPLAAGLILVFFLAVCSFLGCLVWLGRSVLRSSTTPPAALSTSSGLLDRRPLDDNEASMSNPLLAAQPADSAPEAANASADPELGEGARGAASAQRGSRAVPTDDPRAATESAAE
eukprot:TRINITY_DN102220_c0_g1_i1.p1 TRINITY_DN102220_c0_g1~~TRINITY_DN102220_c0_g1_i1.p1  ORF type:complete len:765 (+),score=95.18 TRINITY_DN102220_c0_g1_i1:119-2413(+)